jgi:23S rRNA (cytidine1920-2'-O)/16S rRNA (cytidine1409-2'-O)-methyltransferase
MTALLFRRAFYLALRIEATSELAKPAGVHPRPPMAKLRRMSKKRIDVLLVERGLFESRSKARAAIEAGGVRVNGGTVSKPSDAVSEAADIEAVPAHPWVGRGALKLAHALEVWGISPADKAVLDVGASTGGFTQVCLQGGARRVYAVDVGRAQLHPLIAGDPRVVNIEGLDARKLDRSHLPEPPQLIVCDASFIGLDKVLPAALGLAAPGANLIALVKPQFEVGPERVGKGGVVKDEGARRDALEGVRRFLAKAGWRAVAAIDSPVEGADGNREYLLHAMGPQA